LQEPASRAQQSPRWRRAAYVAAVCLVLLFFLGACLHGVANYWQWGHNGYNGAAFSQAARNSLRFGIVGPAPYHTDLAPPPRDAIFTSHPLMLHFHLIALYGALGFEEWVGRLVPALYSFFTLVLLFFVVRRLYGAATALVAIVLYALIPLQLIYANMIDHEQGGIFWCLCLLYAHVRWYQTGRWPYLAGAAVAVTMAMQFDWPAYYVAFLIAVHAVVAGIVRRPGWLRWRPEYTYVAVFSVVVLLNFGAYFAWIASTRGSLDGMVASFRTRSVSPSGYFSTLGGRSLDLHGAVLLSAPPAGRRKSATSSRLVSSTPSRSIPWSFRRRATFTRTGRTTSARCSRWEARRRSPRRGAG